MLRYIQQVTTLVEVQLQMLGVRTRDDRGFTIEAAVIIFLLVGIAIAGGAILMTKMQSNANNIPDTVGN